MARAVKSPRAYDATGRREAARATRRQVVAAGRELFLERGYAATTMAEVAARAGVAVQTVYTVVGGKAALAKAVFDVAVVGDDEPVSVSERPEIARVSAEPDGRRKVELFATFVSGVLERVTPIELVVRVAADSDAEAADLIERYYQGRLHGMTMFATELKQAGLLRRGLTVEKAAVVLVAHIDPANWHNLVVRGGLTRREFEKWYADITEAAVLRRRVG